MSDERRRILDMLARSVISIEEAEEMLNALGPTGEPPRQKGGTDEPLQAFHAYKPLLIVGGLALVVVSVLTLMGVTGASIVAPVFLLMILSVPFWLWMLLDCILRPPQRFPCLLSPKPETEKLVWLAVVFFGNLLGAVIYLALVHVRHGLYSRPTTTAAGTEEPFEPSAPARSLSWFFWPVFLLALAVAILSVATALIRNRSDYHEFYNLWGNVAVTAAALLSAGALAVVAFSVWMFIDCVARDPREFGASLAAPIADKLFWCLLIAAAPGIGGLAYHFAIRRHPRGDGREGPSGTRAFAKAMLAVPLFAVVMLVGRLLLIEFLFDTHSGHPLSMDFPRTLEFMMALNADLFVATAVPLLYSIAAFVALRVLVGGLTQERNALRPSQKVPEG